MTNDAYTAFLDTAQHSLTYLNHVQEATGQCKLALGASLVVLIVMLLAHIVCLIWVKRMVPVTFLGLVLSGMGAMAMLQYSIAVLKSL